MKKIRGRIHYFGRWARRVDGKLVRVEGDGWQEALEEYKSVAADLHAARTPRAGAHDALTVKELCNRFLTAKQHKVDAGEMGARMMTDYLETCQLLADALGKDRAADDITAADFQALRARMAKRWGPVRLGNAITRIKSVFKFGVDNALLERAPRYGSEFKKPDKAVVRRHRAARGPRLLEAADLRRVLAAADKPTQHAMILLALNGGLGNNDLGAMTMKVMDLDAGWLDYPRPKTGVGRRVPLWAETVEALRAAVAARPAPLNVADAELVFLQRSGRPWVRTTPSSRTDNISVHFGALLQRLGLHREGVNFYTLRHVFRTVADAARDPAAIDLIMGHADPSMGGHYRERIDDDRLRAVADHVRAWLFPEAPGDGQGEPADVEDDRPAPGALEAPPARSKGRTQAADDEPPVLKLFVG
jgi:integrase